MQTQLDLGIFQFATAGAFSGAAAFQAQQQSGGISPGLWIMLIIVLIVIVWGIYITYMPKTAAPTRAETQPAKSRAAAAPPRADDLAIIEGIGPKIAQALNSAGITTFAELARTDKQKIMTILEQAGIRLFNSSSWAEQARLAAAGDMDGLKKLQDRLTAGRSN